jgi:hypothetical protein
MLVLLLSTRLRYYRNYLRHHFDRLVWLEIGVIILILFYFVGRSPADIRYNLKFLLAEDFAWQYAKLWAALPPLFYLSTEALALLGAPTILLLDEATNGLDPESSFQFKKYLREYCDRGGTALFSSHSIETVEHLCDRLIILHQGRVLREMQRQDWQGLRQRGSSLEQEFIAMVKI